MKSLIIALLLPLCCAAQQPKPLQIGDTLPAQAGKQLNSTNFLNSGGPSPFGGPQGAKNQQPETGNQKPETANRKLPTANRLIILDFWATWCGSCYKKFPHLDSLKKEFNDRLQILLVNSISTGDDSSKIDAFFTKRKKLDGFSVQLPYIIGDTLLNDLFPHFALPHYVWIYNNRFIAATNAAQVTASNIRSVLDGVPVTWEIKNDSLHLPVKQIQTNK
jgi:thiol-disulfide isomerase/thioredoxin